MSARSTLLREVLAGERCLNCPSVFDPMSARIAEEAGFDIGIPAVRRQRSRCSVCPT